MFGQTPFGFGAKIDLDKYNQAELANFKTLGFADATAPSVSLRPYTPFPGNQGQYGTCVGWSTGYGVYTIEYALHHHLTNRWLITAGAFDPYYTYEMAQTEDDKSCVNGTFIYDALLNMRNFGAKRIYLDFLDCASFISEEQITDSKNLRIRGFKRLFTYPEEWDGDWNTFFSYGIDKVGPVKQALANNHPVAISMKIPNSFLQIATEKLWEPTPEEKQNAGTMGNNKQLYGHAMCVVGYNDNMYGGAFEIMNSWGGEWADNGFFWVKYADFNQWCAEAFYMDFFEDDDMNPGCVFGDCDNQYSRYVFEDGSMYEGELKGGFFNGNGLYVYPNGDAYAGEWQDGKRHGQGVFFKQGIQPVLSYWDMGTAVQYEVKNTVTPKPSSTMGCIDGDCYDGYGVYVEDGENGKMTYTGTFKDGMKDGYGTIVFDNGARLTATFKADVIDGMGRLETTDGIVYVGEFLLGSKSGYGIMYNSSAYLGGVWLFNDYIDPDAPASTAKKSKMSKPDHAPRSMKMGTADGATAGCASGECQNGYGTFNYSDGPVYTGYFQDGLRHGYGKLVWPDGYTLEGFWNNGNMDGVGTISWADGTYFLGEFRKGKQDGYGIEVGTDGSYLPGIWEFGEYKPGKANLGFASNEVTNFGQDLNIGKSPARKNLDMYMNSVTNHPSVK